MPDKQILFSIITPTWNRCTYLERVHSGLIKQNYKCFEWIVADDGSTDDTESVVRELAIRSDFPVIYIRADCHVGKIRMDNKAIRQAQGLMTVWCDSDDYLVPHALECLWRTWNSIPLDERVDYTGVTALAATEEGCIVNPFPDVDFKDVSWNDLAEVYRVTSDMVFCVRSDLLKAHLFPEVDLVIPESAVWTAIGYKPARFVPEVLLVKEYRVIHAISFASTMNYNRGRAYAMALTERNLRAYKRSWIVRFWRLLTFMRYSLHGEIPIRKARHLWGDNSHNLAYWLIFPFAYFMVVKDALQGKVRYSHREFLVNRDRAIFSIEFLNPGLVHDSTAISAQN